MRKRGGYALNLVHQIKVRVSPKVFNTLQDLAERREATLSLIVRELISKGLAALRP